VERNSRSIYKSNQNSIIVSLSMWDPSS